MRIIHVSALLLAIVGGLLSVAAFRLGPTVDSVTTAHAVGGISVNTEIAVTFTQPMDVPAVERNFRLSPHVAGTFSWSGNTLIYIPRHALHYGTSYLLQIGTGARARSGQHIASPYRDRFTTENEHLLYLGTSGSQRGRLVLASITGQQQILGQSNVTQFSVSADGTTAVYVRRGASGEQPDEIWLLSLADGSTQRLFRRPDWSMDQAHLSPNGQTVVFLAAGVRLCRKYYGCFRDTSTEVVELLDVRSHHVTMFRSGSDTPIANYIDFSPAGQIAFTDLGSALALADPSGSKITHVPNGNNTLQFQAFDPPGDKIAFVGQTQDSTGGDILVYDKGKYLDVSRGIYDSSSPGFSTSGKAIAYAGYRREDGIQPVYGINVYDFASRRTRQLTTRPGSSAWSPAWSPDDRYIAFVRSRPQEAMYMGTGQIWVVKAGGQAAHEVGSAGTDPVWVT